ncbi:HNH endonuclease signature motif containing protein [Ruania halotolerans]|uniref:HNH endonuclease signature motif containing protein n=1 Tax=Ruania halotolerans TaxID=2897773 RepID=UPI001E50F6B2|nr:HNH endonuclease signature motif containing protein [Ruania halotolerans]UFU07286.1 HNH endonuclease [Ruania halotolerans]
MVEVVVDEESGSDGSRAPTALEQWLVREVAEHLSRPLHEQLANHQAGGSLLDRLDLLDLESADDAALVEAVAAARRVESRAHELALRAAAALADRPSMQPGALAEHTRGPVGVAGDELALRLRTTKEEGHRLVRRGRAMQSILTRTGDALALGRIDQARAAAIADGLDGVAWQVAMAVEDAVIERAPRRTAAQVRTDVAKALIAVDPDEAEQRARARRSDRHVSRPRALPDGVASMRIEGPAAEVLTLDVALESAARAAKHEGDVRTLAQLRFDALTGLGSQALAAGTFGASGSGGYSGSERDADAAGGIDVRSGSDGSKGSDGADATHATAGAGAGAGAGVASGVPIGTMGGRRPHIQVTIPFNHLFPEACETGTEAAAKGEKASGTVTEDVAASVAITERKVPVLAGYGPITPAAARAIALGGIWQRLVTDPLTGAVLDVGPARYRPPPAMADLVRARDGTCVRPGCTHQAEYCQLDHTIPFGSGGRTSVSNLGPLCTRDHLIKTHGDFTVNQVEPGVFEWTTPAGYRYRRERDGTTTDLGVGPSGTPRQDHQRGDDPPF